MDPPPSSASSKAAPGVLCLGSGARATGVLNWRMADQQFDSSQELSKVNVVQLSFLFKISVHVLGAFCLQIRTCLRYLFP